MGLTEMVTLSTFGLGWGDPVKVRVAIPEFFL